MSNLGSSDTPIEAESVETRQSITVTDDDTVTLGRDHGNTIQGESVVIGVGAEALADDDGTVANDNPRQVSVGWRAAEGDTGFGVTAAGYRAARNNTGFGVTAAGYQAARDNTGNRVTAIGDLAGYVAGLNDPTTAGDDNIGVGRLAIRGQQASGVIGIGQEAGRGVQTDDLLLITDRDGNRRYKGFLKDKTDENASDLETLSNGAGLIVTSSDGTTRRRITIDNTGSLVTEAV